MKNHKYESPNPLKNPRVARHFRSLSREIDTNLSAHMFFQDVHIAVMPIGGRFSQEQDFSVEIQVSSEHESQVIAILQSLTDSDLFGKSDFKQLLSDVVNKIALYLASGGRSIYEIIRDKENENAWRLYSFTDKRLFRAFGKCIQIIPKADRHLWEKSYVIIPKEDIWEIAMPEVLGGFRGYRSIFKKLSRFSQIVPSFLMDEMSQQKWPTYFNVKNYEKEKNLFVAKTTARWGWHMRSSGLRIWTEFYGMYRFITFDWAKACLREHIIKELNQLFRRLQIDAEIVVKGLPTAREILKTRQQMCEGKITFNEASKRCSMSRVE
ncbi:MAG: hypothetical protein OXD54_09090 [Candidatus Poribacteria bacterium]|nr:hypothetical protein [Candidatus Poribacteria bacterium]